MRWKVMGSVVVLLGIVSLALLAGCSDWSLVGEEDSWNTGTTVINISGYYVPIFGRHLVTANENPPESIQTTEGRIYLGEGDGTNTAFNTSQLAVGPIVPGSITLTDEVEYFADPPFTGDSNTVITTEILTGDLGGTGRVNYATGYAYVRFATPPPDGEDIVMEYQSQNGMRPVFLEGEDAGTHQGSTHDIRTFQIWQVGDNIQLYDNLGGTFAGKVGNPYQGEMQEAIYPFWADGESMGMPVEVTGWVVKAGWILTMRANWVEVWSGRTGFINAMGTGLAEY